MSVWWETTHPFRQYDNSPRKNYVAMNNVVPPIASALAKSTTTEGDGAAQETLNSEYLYPIQHCHFLLHKCVVYSGQKYW